MSRQSQMVRENRQQQVAALYVQGKWQTEIAHLLGISQQQVSYDLKVVQRRWYQASIADLDQRKAQELQKIDAVERECWESWALSKEIRALGDPRFLERIQKCIDQRTALLGIGAREEALKNAGLGLAALLDEARQQPLMPTLAPPTLPMAQA